MNKVYEDIGKKIKMVREKTGLSQEELSQRVGVSRTAISQIENQNRKIDVCELRRLSETFGMSVDEFLNSQQEPAITISGDTEEKQEQRLRISVPRKNYEKFKEVLIYILDKVGSKPNIGETVIYKLLYFIDFDFYEKYEVQLIGATYQKNKFGPTPMEFKTITDKMIQDTEIVKVRSKYFAYPQTKYLPLRKARTELLNGAEIEMIDEVLARFSDLTARQISEHSHGDVPWLTTRLGEVIDYESVYYRTPGYSVRDYSGDMSEDI